MGEAKLNEKHDTLSLAAKIAKISDEIGAISKDGKNDQQKYSFIEYAQVAARARRLQAEYGVAIIPTVEEYECHEVQNKYNNVGYHYQLKIQFTVINCDDPNDKIISNWIGEATDYGDKGVNKAITSAVKYFIMRLYNISEKDEREADKDTPEPAVAPKNTVKNKPKIDQVFLAKVRAKLPTINTDEELNAYWKELHLNKMYYKILMSDFKKRRGEIANGVE